jgi:hypothetical protein
MFQIKQETGSKQIGLKRGLTNVQHNEDFHLLYPQFFQAVKNIAPHSVEVMIRSSLLEARSRGRLLRSPLRRVFNLFLLLQTRGLLWPSTDDQVVYGTATASGAGAGAGSGGPAPAVFPDRVDWVEFLDFVSRVDTGALAAGGLV